MTPIPDKSIVTPVSDFRIVSPRTDVYTSSMSCIYTGLLFYAYDWSSSMSCIYWPDNMSWMLGQIAFMDGTCAHFLSFDLQVVH
jgi:hypothetical protein